MKTFKILLTIIFAITLTVNSYAGPTGKEATYITLTVIQGKGQSEIIVHRGGDSKVEDEVIRTKDDTSKDIDPEREKEYNKVIDKLNELAKEGYEVVNMSVTMAGQTNVHPYTVYLLKKVK